MKTEIELALETWYRPEVPFDEQVNQAVLQLCSEAGELIGIYGDEYIDELGDYWYYIRILAHLFGIDLSECEPIWGGSVDLVCMATEISGMWAKHLYKPNREIDIDALVMCLKKSKSTILHECKRVKITIGDLTQSNYEKLKGGHGWNGSDKKISARHKKLYKQIFDAELYGRTEIPQDNRSWWEL